MDLTKNILNKTLKRLYVPHKAFIRAVRNSVQKPGQQMRFYFNVTSSPVVNSQYMKGVTVSTLSNLSMMPP